MAAAPVGGEVHLVGSGIGGAGYLTVRARALLRRADAIVYDALADEELLTLAPGHCEFFFMGKRGGQRDKSAAQADIDALLVSLATAGKHRVIVRLKAGDPFIFGRARSEVEALNAANVAWHVEPGLSSALAGPLLAGIALTDPKLSQAFTVMSAFDAQGLPPDKLAGLGEADTLVFLMGGSRLGLLCGQMRAVGRRATTPVAIVKWAGHPDKQQIWRGTLDTIEGITEGLALSPAVIIVGDTAGYPMLSSATTTPPRPAARPTTEGNRAGGGGAGGGIDRRYDTWMLDLDGVLWGGSGVVEGSVEAVRHLTSAGARVLYVTNNSARTRKAVADKLMGLGFASISEGDVVTSGWAAAEYLCARTPACRNAFVIGSPALVSELRARGIACVTAEDAPTLESEADFAGFELDPEVDAVVCGWDPTFSWTKLAAASAYIQSGLPLVATNPDTANRVAGRLMPENGSQVAAIVAAAGVSEDSVIVVGKPSPLLVETVVRKWQLDPARTIMVGDRLDTDIVFGNRAGIATALVLSGVASRQDVAAVTPGSESRPSYLLTNLHSAISGEGLEVLDEDR